MLPSFAEKVMVHKRIIFLDVDVADLVWSCIYIGAFCSTSEQEKGKP